MKVFWYLIVFFFVLLCGFLVFQIFSFSPDIVDLTNDEGQPSSRQQLPIDLTDNDQKQAQPSRQQAQPSSRQQLAINLTDNDQKQAQPSRQQAQPSSRQQLAINLTDNDQKQAQPSSRQQLPINLTDNDQKQAQPSSRQQLPIDLTDNDQKQAQPSSRQQLPIDLTEESKEIDSSDQQTMLSRPSIGSHGVDSVATANLKNQMHLVNELLDVFDVSRKNQDLENEYRKVTEKINRREQQSAEDDSDESFEILTDAQVKAHLAKSKKQQSDEEDMASLREAPSQPEEFAQDEIKMAMQRRKEQIELQRQFNQQQAQEEAAKAETSEKKLTYKEQAALERNALRMKYLTAKVDKWTNAARQIRDHLKQEILRRRTVFWSSFVHEQDAKQAAAAEYATWYTNVYAFKEKELANLLQKNEQSTDKNEIYKMLGIDQTYREPPLQQLDDLQPAEQQLMKQLVACQLRFLSKTWRKPLIFKSEQLDYTPILEQLSPYFRKLIQQINFSNRGLLYVKITIDTEILKQVPDEDRFLLQSMVMIEKIIGQSTTEQSFLEMKTANEEQIKELLTAVVQDQLDSVQIILGTPLLFKFTTFSYNQVFARLIPFIREKIEQQNFSKKNFDWVHTVIFKEILQQASEEKDLFNLYSALSPQDLIGATDFDNPLFKIFTFDDNNETKQIVQEKWAAITTNRSDFLKTLLFGENYIANLIEAQNERYQLEIDRRMRIAEIIVMYAKKHQWFYSFTLDSTLNAVLTLPWFLLDLNPIKVTVTMSKVDMSNIFFKKWENQIDRARRIQFVKDNPNITDPEERALAYKIKKQNFARSNIALFKNKKQTIDMMKMFFVEALQSGVPENREREFRNIHEIWMANLLFEDYFPLDKTQLQYISSKLSEYLFQFEEPMDNIFSE